MNNIVLNEELLSSNLSINYQRDLILSTALNLISINLISNSDSSSTLGVPFNFYFPLSAIFIEGSILNFDTTDLLLTIDVAVVDEASGQVKFACMVQIASNDGCNKIKFINLSVFAQKSIDILLDERSIVISLMENWVIEYPLQEAKVIIESYDFVVPKSLLHELNGLLPVFAVGDELGNHRVIESGNSIVFSNSSFDSDPFIFSWLFKVF
jgi:hypothetical protein